MDFAHSTEGRSAGRLRTNRLPREALLVFVVALAARLLGLVLLGSGRPQVLESETFHHFGWEEFAIAQALARGDGFADAFGRGTGPSAWTTPAYPILLAGLIRIFGGLNSGLAVTLFVCQGLLSSATAVLLWRIGLDAGGPRLGRVAAWLYALYPTAVYYPVTLVWHSTLAAFVMTLFFAVLTRAGPRAGLRDVVKSGLLFGAAVLVTASPIAFAPVVLYFLCRYRDSAGEAVRVGLLFGGSALLAVSPWCVRNLVVLGTPAIRTNLGVELMVGNNDDATGGFNALAHPSQSEEEHERYAQLGEIDYAALGMQRFRAWLRANPGRFAELTARRFMFYWFGRPPTHVDHWDQDASVKADLRSWIRFGLQLLLGVAALVGLAVYRGPREQRVLLRGVLLLYPVIYGLTHVLARYRFPIEPMMMLASAALICRLSRLPYHPNANEE